MHAYPTDSDYFNEAKLHSLTKKCPQASRSIEMAENWPRPLVLKREVPLFTEFRIKQLHLECLIAWHQGPHPVFVDNGEPVYRTWDLALWFCEVARQPEDILHIPFTDLIPVAWFADPLLHAQYRVNLNTYEVLLHRRTEQNDCVAQALLKLTSIWPDPTVTLKEISRFSHGKMTTNEFKEWVCLSQHIKTPDPLMRWEKWELAFWLYEMSLNIPNFMLSSIMQIDGTLSSAIHSAATMPWNKNGHLTVADMLPTEWVDQWELISWSERLIRTMPLPIHDRPSHRHKQ